NSRSLTATDFEEVQIQDMVSPFFTFVPPDMFVNTTTPVLPEPIAADNCPGPLRIVGLSPTVFPVGQTTVQWIAFDRHELRSDVATTVVTVDLNRPSCALTGAILGPPKQFQVTAQDPESGLKSVVVNTATNLTTNVPAFTPGMTTPLVISATKA